MTFKVISPSANISECSVLYSTWLLLLVPSLLEIAEFLVKFRFEIFWNFCHVVCLSRRNGLCWMVTTSHSIHQMMKLRLCSHQSFLRIMQWRSLPHQTLAVMIHRSFCLQFVQVSVRYDVISHSVTVVITILSLFRSVYSFVTDNK